MSDAMMKRFAAYIDERYAIRQRRDAGQPWPWTRDAILRDYKFTNVFRADDRTTRAFVAIYQKHALRREPIVGLLNCVVYRYFGTAEFATAIGWLPTWSARVKKTVCATARRRLANHERVFTGAYLVTNCGRVGPKEEVVCSFIDGLYAEAPQVIEAYMERRSWRLAYEEMTKVQGFGGKGFMAKEVLQDLMLAYPGVAVDADEWTPVGPGARRGLNRIYGRPLDWDTANKNAWTEEVLAAREGLAGRLANPLIYRMLTAHDVQFNLCEFDKYERVRLGQGRSRSRYAKPAELLDRRGD